MLTPFQRPHSVQTEGFRRKLLHDWQLVWNTGVTYRVTIRKGAEWNASVPGIAFPAVSPEQLEVPSLPHDVLYRYEGCFLVERERAGQWHRITYGRRFADQVFDMLMQEVGVTGWRRWLARQAVRWGGHFLWRDSTYGGSPKIDDYSIVHAGAPCDTFTSSSQGRSSSDAPSRAAPA